MEAFYTFPKVCDLLTFKVDHVRREAQALLSVDRLEQLEDVREIWKVLLPLGLPPVDELLDLGVHLGVPEKKEVL